MSKQRSERKSKPKRRRNEVEPHYLPIVDRQLNFEEVNLGYQNQDEVFVEAMRCYSCRKPNCVEACPGNFDVRNMLVNIQENRFQEAADMVNNFYCFSESFNRVCPAFCQDVCTAGKKGDPVNVLHIKRFLAENYVKPPNYYDKLQSTGIKIAIIGSGPAGLTAAHALAKMGHEVTVFEKHYRTGGMLAIGIPEYRLPDKILDQEIKDLEKFGIEFRLGVTFGEDLTINDLRSQGYKAFLISHGAHKPKWMGIPGEREISGVYHAIDFLRSVALGDYFELGERVAIIGGGDVAIDAARTAWRLGKQPFIIYRRTRDEMPATQEEIEETEHEGIPMYFLRNPVKILGEDRVTGIEVIQMELGEPDSSGRRRPVAIEGSNFVIPVDNVIMAISQEPEAIIPDINLSRWNTFDVGKASYMTEIPGVFAAGDNVSGPKTAIEAIVQGKEAAIEIEEYVQKYKSKALIEVI